MASTRTRSPGSRRSSRWACWPGSKARAPAPSSLPGRSSIYGRVLTTQELIEQVEKVEAADLQALVERLLDSPTSLATVGPILHVARFDAVAEKFTIPSDQSRVKRVCPPMALLRTASPSDLGPVIESERVVLRTPQMSDYPAWAELRAASREFLDAVGAALGQ